MPERRLSETMLRFLDRNVDVLVSTTIVESGLDIPNANTIILDRADILGLAEMHQLRGRVGRYVHRAYAYFFTPQSRPVTPEAEERLDTIRRFSRLGSGFDIALRDMEIRGAGNILGPRQSGHIAAIGYNMYCRLMNQTIRHMKGEPLAEQPDVTISIGLEAYLPDDYVPTPRQKMEVYRQMNRCLTLEDLTDVAAGLRDRFGPPPGPAECLLLEVELRILAARAGVDLIRLRNGRLHFGVPDRVRLRERLGDDSGVRFLSDGLAVYAGAPPPDDPPALAAFLRDLFAGARSSA